MKHRTSKILIISFLYVNTVIAQDQTMPRAEISQPSVREIRLINTAGVVEQEWSKKADFEIRRRCIHLNTTALSPLSVAVGDIMNISLFEGEEYSVKINRVVVDVNNVLSVSGKIDGTRYGFFYLSTKNGIVLAMLEIAERRKSISLSIIGPQISIMSRKSIQYACKNFNARF